MRNPPVVAVILALVVSGCASILDYPNVSFDSDASTDGPGGGSGSSGKGGAAAHAGSSASGGAAGPDAGTGGASGAMDGGLDGSSGGSAGAGGSAGSAGGVTIGIPFSFRMAGAFVLGNDPLDGTAPQLIADHFSYIGNYAVNGCQNNNTPYSCNNNGCNYPGNPSSEILAYDALRDWMNAYKQSGLYVGLWGVTYDNVEAEAHCMAEVANTLETTHGVTAVFFDIDGEKSFETHQDYSQRFVDEFNKTLTVSLAKAYTPECHTAVPLGPWLNGGFTSIMPMAYWNDVGTNPAYCLDWVVAYGAAKEQSQVMLDGYRHGAPHSWTEYANDIHTWGAKGFSVWRTLNGAEWDQFKPLIETQAIAEYDPAL